MASAQELNFLSGLFPFTGVVFLIAFGVVLLNQVFRKNLMRQKLKQEELKTLHHQELLRTSIEAQEVERKRIASDLHDELGAVLSIARMHLIQLEEHSAELQLAAVQNIRTLTESALVSMRRISHELMPAQLESFGLVKTLEGLATRTNTEGGIHLHVVAGELPILPWHVQLGVYRICLELITNTLKHAEARMIEIKLVHQSSQLTVYYCDDGKGLLSASAPEGLGTTNLEARVSALSGRIVPTQSTVGGFSLTLEIPLNTKR